MHTAKWEMVEAGGRTSQAFGLSRLFGQIYTYLYLSPEPQSLDELAEGLGVSKASVSIAARQLESWGALRCIWKRGDRRDYYEAETDFRRLDQQGFARLAEQETRLRTPADPAQPESAGRVRPQRCRRGSRNAIGRGRGTEGAARKAAEQPLRAPVALRSLDADGPPSKQPGDAGSPCGKPLRNRRGRSPPALRRGLRKS